MLLLLIVSILGTIALWEQSGDEGAPGPRLKVVRCPAAKEDRVNVTRRIRQRCRTTTSSTSNRCHRDQIGVASYQHVSTIEGDVRWRDGDQGHSVAGRSVIVVRRKSRGTASYLSGGECEVG